MPDPGFTLRASSSDALSRSFLCELRALLDGAFGGDFTDADWQHTLGGVHVWLTGVSGLLSHAAVVERALICAGQVLVVGYVEAVATASAHRRRGHASTVMSEVDDRIRAGYGLGALSTGTPAFYETLGWERWRGPTFAVGPHGRVRTPDDDGSIMILRTPRTPALDLDAEIVCDWRDGEVW